MTAIYGSTRALGSKEQSKMGALLCHHGPVLSSVNHGASVLCSVGVDQQSVFDTDALLLAVAGQPFAYAPDGRSELLNAEALAEMFWRDGWHGLKHINGHFAIVFFDKAEQRLFLARDAFGTTPLYYAHFDDGEVLFSSEYKAIILEPELPKSADEDGVAGFMRRGWAPTRHSFFEAVKPVPAGTVIAVHEGQVSSFPIHGQKLAQPEPSADIAVEDILAVTKEAVGSHVALSGGRIGMALSSGMDSAMIAALIQSLRPNDRLHTFTVGSGSDDPEIQGARETSAVLGTIHHEVIVQADALKDLLPQAVFAMEEPGGHYQCCCLYALWREAAEHVDDMFSGNISDTLFGGMSAHRDLWAANHLPLVRSWIQMQEDAQAEGGRPQGWLGQMAWWLRSLQDYPPSCSVREKDVLRDTDMWQIGRFEGSLYDNLLFSLQNWDGRIAGQTALANSFGLRLHFPFADLRVLDVALRVPEHQRVSLSREKIALREAAALILPTEISKRPKRVQQLRYDEAMAETLNEMIRTYLLQGHPSAHELINLQTVRQLMNEDGQAYSKGTFHRLWNAVAVEIWSRTFRKEQPIRVLHEERLFVADDFRTAGAA